MVFIDLINHIDDYVHYYRINCALKSARENHAVIVVELCGCLVHGAGGAMSEWPEPV